MVLGYRVVRSFPHDPTAWPQGLVFHDGALLESTGLYGRSSLREVELKSGKVKRKVALPKSVFAEGIAISNGRIYQLTWKNRMGFIYVLSSLERISEFHFDHEGWGMASDGTHLIVSDGTPVLRFYHPEPFRLVKEIRVHYDETTELDDSNALAYVRGEILACNRYTSKIYRIDPATGKILGWIKLNRLAQKFLRDDDEHELNGLAYDADTDRLFVTGKNWSKVFQIRLVPLL